MASKRSHSSKKKKRSSLFSRLATIVWIVGTGGGVAGLTMPDLPVLGPLVQRIVASSPLKERSGQTPPTVALKKGQPAGKNGQLADAKRTLTEKLKTIPGVSDALAAKPPSQPAAIATTSRKPPGTITIASFNIQVFGESKLSKSWVIDILAKVVRQFDVVAIQEIRSKKDHIIPQFVAAVNADGSRYHYVIGPRLGRSVSKEQYVFVYDTTRIEVDSSSTGTIQDPKDKMHREPFVTRFRARTATPDRSFTFWLINAHTDPDEVPEEVDVLADVFLVMQQARPDEDDVILLGDLNANDRQFGRLGKIPGITWAIRGVTTNTRRSKMYDNILFDRNRTAEFTGRWGVYDLEATFRLSREQALQVSDHLPVWAEFQAYEAPLPNTAGRPLGVLRR